jgi:hypothetical protein
MMDSVEEWSKTAQMTPIELGSLDRDLTKPIDTTPPREWTWKQSWARATFEEYKWNVTAATVQEIAYALRESKRIPDHVYAYHEGQRVEGDHEVATGEEVDYKLRHNRGWRPGGTMPWNWIPVEQATNPPEGMVMAFLGAHRYPPYVLRKKAPQVLEDEAPEDWVEEPLE